ncbi:MAG: hypothetical protein E3J64_04115 [Anaerolineales bacterium]|nr:MAG: hypothetical protein E3J64_04115 [Anaerolineales bacterium]
MNNQTDGESQTRRTLAHVAVATFTLVTTSLACIAPQPTVEPTPSPSATPLPSATPSPTLDPLEYAVDFTLAQGDGPEFTLSEQLAAGPVVIAFFQRGGG